MLRICTLSLLATLAVSALALAAGQNTSEKSSSSDQRVFELRTYYTNAGKLDDLHKRFRDHTNRIFKKHGIEIVGFWTPQYLASKLEKLRQTDTVCLLCVDEDRACATADFPNDLPPHLPVVRFRRRIDAAAVLREVERLTDDQTSHAA